jgi:hypothetical protein
MPEASPPAASPAAPSAPPSPPASTPPWGDDFDAKKAWDLIQNLRTDKEKLALRPVLDDEAKRKLAEFDRLEAAAKTDLERKTEEVTRWQSEAEKWRAQSVSSTIQALAAADFADPTDAANALDAAKYLDAGGAIDNEAIKKDLADLLERKPHYKRSQEAPTPRVPAPNRAQGAPAAGPSDPAAEFGALLQRQLAR